MQEFNDMVDASYKAMMNMYKSLQYDRQTSFDVSMPSMESDIFATVAINDAYLQFMIGSIANSVDPGTCSPEKLRILSAERNIDYKGAIASKGKVNILFDIGKTLPVGFKLSYNDFEFVFDHTVTSVRNSIPIIGTDKTRISLFGYAPLSLGMIVHLNTNSATVSNGDYEIIALDYFASDNKTEIVLKGVGFSVPASGYIAFNGLYNYSVTSLNSGINTNVPVNATLDVSDSDLIHQARVGFLGIVGGEDKEPIDMFRRRVIDVVEAVENNIYNIDFIKDLLRENWYIDEKRFYTREQKDYITIGVLMKESYPFLTQVLHAQMLYFLYEAKPVKIPKESIKIIGLEDVKNKVVIKLAKVSPETETMNLAIVNSFRELNKIIKFNEKLEESRIREYIESAVNVNLSEIVKSYELLGEKSFPAIEDKLTQIEKVVIGKNTYKVPY